MSDAHEHPSDWKYIQIAIALAAITAVEVALSYVKWGNANAPLLLIGMAVKFFLVASFFMHLKFDSKLLRRLFISGLVLAVFCYIAALSTFRHFDKDERQQIKYVPSGIPQQ
jgi:cytochrome c oxidase subunit 4